MPASGDVKDRYNQSNVYNVKIKNDDTVNEQMYRIDDHESA
jgi:hypothetical protein